MHLYQYLGSRGMPDCVGYQFLNNPIDVDRSGLLQFHFVHVDGLITGVNGTAAVNFITKLFQCLIQPIANQRFRHHIMRHPAHLPDTAVQHIQASFKGPRIIRGKHQGFFHVLKRIFNAA